jgi:hypothetical protein
MSADERRTEERHNHDPFAELLEEARIIRRLMTAGGRPFSVEDGGSTDAGGACVVSFRGPSIGQLWRVESVGVSVGGASAAAVIACYLSAQDERNLLPGFFLNALQGAGPARGFMAPPRPGYVWGGVPLVVVVAGAVANQQGAVQVRVQGRVEDLAEVQGGAGISTLPGPPVTAGQV